MAQQPQTFKNHAMFDPLWHYFLAPVAILMVIVTLVQLIRSPGWDSGAHIIAALWAFGATLRIRTYALKVQDRVIRLEEQVRLKELCPPSFRGRIGEFTEDQLIGLRFASDAEVPELAQKVLAGNWKRKQIKEGIRNWRADYWRV